MTVTALPTRTTSQWSGACAALRETVRAADHPLVTGHATIAEAMLLEAGCPTQSWADRIAAIAVIAERRADLAPTIERRIGYLDLADAAVGLLELAERLHRTRPSEEAASVLRQTSMRTAALGS